MRKKLSPAQERARAYHIKRWIRVLKTTVLLITVIGVVFTVLGIIGNKTYPNIVLVTVDSFRPDHLSLYGYQQNTTPNLEKIARDGIVFKRFYTTVPRSAGAAVSLFSGRYPQNTGFRVTMASLAKTEKTLAKYLKIYEYQTAAFSGNPVVSQSRGIGKGFDSFLSVPRPIIAERLTGRLLDWLKKHQTRHFFAWIHYHDPSRPYLRFPFTKTPERGRQRNLSLFHFNQDGMITSDKIFDRAYSPDQQTATIDRYDEDIHAVDTQLGKINAFLRNNNLTKNTILVIAGLHGENLGDHYRHFGHGEFLYNTTIKVPLVIRYPRKLPDPVTIGEVTRIIDVAPTILSLAEVKYKSELMDGENLYPFLKDDNKVLKLKAFVESGETFFPDYKQYRKRSRVAGYSRAIIDKDKKLIMTPGPQTDQYEFYDLGKDLYEKRNRIHNSNYSREITELKAELAKWMRLDYEKDKTESLVEKRLKLYSLGYLQALNSKKPNKFIKMIQEDMEKRKRKKKKKK
ncbi:MAG: sulfatase [bacterium]